MKRKLVVGVVLLASIVSLTFAAGSSRRRRTQSSSSSYSSEREYRCTVRCTICNGTQEISVHAKSSSDAESEAKKMFTGHKMVQGSDGEWYSCPNEGSTLYHLEASH